MVQNLIWLVSLQEEEIWTQTCTQRLLCENEGRDQGEAADANEGQRLLPDHQRLGEKNEQISLPSPQEELIQLTT